MSQELHPSHNDIIRIGDEVMRVISVGVGGLQCSRSETTTWNSSLEPHNSGTTVTKMTGSYNIVGSTINFVSPPYGVFLFRLQVLHLLERDYTGLTTHSTFQGRTFMRSSPVNSTRETYYHHVFDNVSNEFTGIRSEFRLTQGGQNVTGFSTDNAIILINNIFQEPQGLQS